MFKSIQESDEDEVEITQKATNSDRISTASAMAGAVILPYTQTNTSQDLDILSIQNRDKPYRCPRCSFGLNSKGGLTTHLKTCYGLGSKASQKELRLIKAKVGATGGQHLYPEKGFLTQSQSLPNEQRPSQNQINLSAGTGSSVEIRADGTGETSNSTTKSVSEIFKEPDDNFNLDSILTETDGDIHSWPATLRANLNSHGISKLPNGSWPMIKNFFENKFDTKISLKELQRLASHKNSTKPSDNIYKKSRTKTVDLANSRIDNETKAMFKTIRAQVAEETLPRTRKFDNSKVPRQVWDTINRCILEEIPNYQIITLKNIIDLLKTSQGTIQAFLENQRAKRKISNSPNKEGLASEIERLESILIDIECVPISEISKEYIQNNIKYPNSPDAINRTARNLEQIVALKKKKLSDSNRRKQFARENFLFTTSRKRFYRNLKQPTRNELPESLVDNAKSMWEKMWCDERQLSNESFDMSGSLFDSDIEGSTTNDTIEFPTIENMVEIIKNLDNWKACGPDNIYNITIKQTTAVHKLLHQYFTEISKNPTSVDDSFFKGITYLLPKIESPKSGKDFRPITCLSNVYKLYTKILTNVLVAEVESNNLLESNQMGTVRNTQGAKELAMFNKAINTISKTKMKVAWLDCQKAFDSILHTAIIETIEKLKISTYIKNFIKKALDTWQIDIRLNSKTIINQHKIQRGIIQGDSLSPMLFCLVMNNVSKDLNQNCPKLTVRIDEPKEIEINHLLYMDDIKLFAKDQTSLKKLTQRCKQQLEKIGLSLNREKSKANTKIDIIEQIEKPLSYKYLGMDESPDQTYTKETMVRIEAEMSTRLNLLLKSELNSANLITAINEWVISLTDYPTGIINTDKSWAPMVDKTIRKMLSTKNIFIEGACIERLYMKRKQLCRGLSNVEFREERLLLKLNSYLQKAGNDEMHTMRKKAILKAESMQGSKVAAIENKIQKRYGTTEISELFEAQRKSLIESIKSKTQHSKLFSDLETFSICSKTSALSLTHSNISPRSEASITCLQDQNTFWITGKPCPHCHKSNTDLEHIATLCPSLVPTSYRRRHDEIVKGIALRLTVNMGAQKDKRISKFKCGDSVKRNGKILLFDQTIKTTRSIKFNKPDLVMIDTVEGTINIYEIGVTTAKSASRVFAEKLDKYQILLNELLSIYKLNKGSVNPLIFTWNGLCTRNTAKTLTDLNLTKKETAYLLNVSPRRTSEMLFNTDKRQE